MGSRHATVSGVPVDFGGRYDKVRLTLATVHLRHVISGNLYEEDRLCPETSEEPGNMRNNRGNSLNPSDISIVFNVYPT